MCGLRCCQGLFVEWAENLYAGDVAQALLLSFVVHRVAWHILGGEAGKRALVVSLPGMGDFQEI